MARVTEDTIMAQIRKLTPGQSFSRSKRLALEDPNRDTTADALMKLRNLVNQSVGRARKEEGGSNFRVESVVGVTDDKKAMLCTVAVTRMNSAAEADPVENDDEETDI